MERRRSRLMGAAKISVVSDSILVAKGGFRDSLWDSLDPGHGLRKHGGHDGGLVVCEIGIVITEEASGKSRIRSNDEGVAS